MKQKVPHSPFSTRLSGSARETELRIRNIFQWKKKRPPVALFLLTAVLVLSCCGLVSCQTEATPDNSEDAVVSDSWIYEPADDPIETVRRVIEGQDQKEYTFTVRVDSLAIDEDETARVADRYRGSELAQTRGWPDEVFDEDFVVVHAQYYAEYDHTLTFLDDGTVYQYFYLMRNTETGLWSVVDNTSSSNSDPANQNFFVSYVTDFPSYTYTGWKTSDHNGHVFTMEDTPNNLAEAAVIDWYRLNWTEETEKLDLVCGNESLLFGSPSFFQSYTIHKLTTLPPDDFTVENMPFLDSFFRWLREDIREFGLTEYTIVYTDLSWEWTPEQLALGPQLGNGRYERLYLVGKTAPDLGWKLYEVYWGEHVFNRIFHTDTPDTPLPGEEHFVLLPVGNEVSVDLNGDGRAETVLVDLKQNEYDASYTLSIDHKDYTSTLQQPGIYFDSPQNEFAITDLDTGDGLLEIALPDDGPSSDPHTLFLRWDGTALHSLGEVYGKVNYRDLVFDGMGTISSTMRLSVLQTWFAPVLWRVNAVGEFGIVHQDLYYPIQYGQPQTITALKELAAYADRDPESECTALPVGTKFTLTATDNAHWVQCTDETGTQFWLRLDEESGHSVELSDGNYSWQALDGLIMAD